MCCSYSYLYAYTHTYVQKHVQCTYLCTNIQYIAAQGLCSLNKNDLEKGGLLISDDSVVACRYVLKGSIHPSTGHDGPKGD